MGWESLLQCSNDSPSFGWYPYRTNVNSWLLSAFNIMVVKDDRVMKKKKVRYNAWAEWNRSWLTVLAPHTIVLPEE